MSDDTDDDRAARMTRQAAEIVEPTGCRLLEEGGIPLMLTGAALLAGYALSDETDINRQTSNYATHVLHVADIAFVALPPVQGVGIPLTANPAALPPQALTIMELQRTFCLLLGGMLTTHPGDDAQAVMSAWLGALLDLGTHWCGADELTRVLRCIIDGLPAALAQRDQLAEMMQRATSAEVGRA